MNTQQALYKIGEFSKLAQVSPRMLRHYDKLGLLQPSHVDRFTDYRYYTVDQLARLNRIIALKDLGFSLEQIGDLLDQQGGVNGERLRGMLQLRRAEIEQELRASQARLLSVEARLHQIEQEGQPLPYEIVVKPVDPIPVACLRQVVPSVAEMGYYCESMYRSLYTNLAQLRITPLTPEVTLYHNEDYAETDLDTEVAVAVAQDLLAHPPQHDLVRFREVPGADLCACLIYEGSYDELTIPILALLQWVGRHDHRIAGPLRELHLSGPAHPDGSVADSAVIELQVPIVAQE